MIVDSSNEKKIEVKNHLNLFSFYDKEIVMLVFHCYIREKVVYLETTIQRINFLPILRYWSSSSAEEISHRVPGQHKFCIIKSDLLDFCVWSVNKFKYSAVMNMFLDIKI